MSAFTRSEWRKELYAAWNQFGLNDPAFIRDLAGAMKRAEPAMKAEKRALDKERAGAQKKQMAARAKVAPKPAK